MGAVAIIITIMVLELKTPLTEEPARYLFGHMLFEIGTYLLSFVFRRPPGEKIMITYYTRCSFANSEKLFGQICYTFLSVADSICNTLDGEKQFA